MSMHPQDHHRHITHFIECTQKYDFIYLHARWANAVKKSLETEAFGEFEIVGLIPEETGHCLENRVMGSVHGNTAAIYFQRLIKMDMKI